MNAGDIDILRGLNESYVRAAETSDIGWFAQNLAHDFLSSSADAALIDKPGFLQRMEQPYPGSRLRAVDVRIRIIGDIALIHAGFRYTKTTGEEGNGRYTDIWAHREGCWLCVSAHFNRF